MKIVTMLFNYRNIRRPCNTISKLYSTKATKDGLHYCTNIVRQHDYENFLATLLLRRSLRSSALVIRAFNVEVARIQDQSTDHQTAAFRLQFWLDAIKEIYKVDQKLNNVPATPIIQELYKVCSTHSLPRRHLEKLISSRSNLIRSNYFRTLEDLERYAEDTVSSIYYLLLSVAGVQNIHADHVASHLGKAQGIANILRSVFVSSQHRTVTLPMEILMKHNVSQENVLRNVDSDAMRCVTFEIATKANDHLMKARSIKIPKETHQIFLPTIFVESYLKKLEKRDFNMFDKSLKLRSVLLPFNLYYKRLLNKY